MCQRDLSLALRGEVFKVTDATPSKNKCRAQIDGIWERQNEQLKTTLLSVRLIQSFPLSLGSAVRGYA